MPYKLHLRFVIPATFGLTGLLTTPPIAQAGQEEYDNELTLEKVIVTGTRIKTVDGFGRTSPVTIVDMEEISASGYTRVEDVLNTLPQVEPGQSAFENSLETSGTATINLRGLGANRTLVLINGHRMQPGGVYEESPDINQIPAHMIERVEILTGGASATYGADAVAGVVNFIMRRVNGVEISTGINGYQHDNRNHYIQGLMDDAGYAYPVGNTGIDGKGYTINIVIGSDFADGRGNATAYANWRKNDPLLGGARDYSSCTLNGRATACGGSTTTPVPQFWLAPLTADGLGPYGYNYDREGFFLLQPDSSLLRQREISYRYNYAPINYTMRPDERWSLGAFVDYKINKHAVVYLETMGFNDASETRLAESGTFYVDMYPLSLGNAYFPENFRQSLEEFFPDENDFGIYIGKRNIEGGPRSDQIQHSSLRIVTGLRGSITADWDYDASYVHARTSSSTSWINDIFLPRIATAVDSRLCEPDPACIPYQVFTYQGVTAEAAASLGGTGISGADTATDIIQAYVTGDTARGLPAGNILAVVGYEYRSVSFERVSDEAIEEGQLSGKFPSPNLGGSYSVNEVFFEANVPLLADRKLARAMTLDLAYRYSDYSSSGGNSTYRAGLDWQIVDWLRFRSGYNRAVRAPNIRELYYPQGIGAFGAQDPCSGEVPLYNFEQCARTGVTAAQYGNILSNPYEDDSLFDPWLNFLGGGNPELDPEMATTITLGLVFDIGESMRLSFDYWDIKIEDAIGDLNPAWVIDECAIKENLCDLFHRAPSGSLWRSDDGYIIATEWNLSEEHSRGIDMEWHWSPGMHWQAGLVGTYYLEKETTPLAGDQDISWDCAGVVSNPNWGAEAWCSGPPKWRHIATVSYGSESFWSITARWRYYSERDYIGTRDQIAANKLGAISYLDLSAVIRLMETHDLSVGINNIFDKEPPLVGASISTGGYYDILGRYLFANLTLRW